MQEPLKLFIYKIVRRKATASRLDRTGVGVSYVSALTILKIIA